MNSKDVYYFERRYNARVRPSKMVIQTPVRTTWQDHVNSHIYDMTTTTESVPAVEIVMTEDSFKELIALSHECDGEEYRHYKYMTSRMDGTWLNNVLNQQDRNQREAYLRRQNPALQDAWEQYQVLLKLVE